MKNNELNIAVVGVGYWGRKVATEYSILSSKSPDVRLFGVCDVFDDNLIFCRDVLKIPYQTKDLQQILENQSIDAVHICTPSVTHFDICRACLEYGKHVTVEKPMTLDSLEAMKLVDLANEKGLVLSVGHIFRFDASIEKAKKMIEDGWFGDLYWIKLSWTALMPLMLGRDVITDLAPHPFDILNFLTGYWPKSITCVARAHRKDQQEETAFITCEYVSNLVGHIEVSWQNPLRRREVQIMGSKGFAIVNCITQEIEAHENGQIFQVPVEKSNTISGEIIHFAQCIKNHRPPVEGFINKNNGLVGANVVKLLEIAKASMINRRSEPVS